MRRLPALLWSSQEVIKDGKAEPASTPPAARAPDLCPSAQAVVEAAEQARQITEKAICFATAFLLQAPLLCADVSSSACSIMG